MKNLPLLLLASLTLSACNDVPGQVSGSQVSVGVAVDDSGSVELATKTVTPATDNSPEQVKWTLTRGEGVTFTFMTRPGSHAVYLNSYRVTKRVLRTANGTSTSTDSKPVQKMDLYLTSGYSCATRTTLNSCPYGGADTVPANGLPVQHAIYLEGGLGDTVVATNASVTEVNDLEFYGTSGTGQPVTVTVTGVVSSGSKQGDQ